jgi:hypothetical protein
MRAQVHHEVANFLEAVIQVVEHDRELFIGADLSSPVVQAVLKELRDSSVKHRRLGIQVEAEED